MISVPDSIGAHGGEHVRTPNIDRLVERGYSFRRNYCMGSIHGAVCQPSRAMLNSGKTLYRVKMNLAGAKLLPELLRENGYTTFGTGKWHNGKESFLRGFEKGTAVFLGGMSNHLAVPVQDVTPEGGMTKREAAEPFFERAVCRRGGRILEGATEGEAVLCLRFVHGAPTTPRQPPAKFVKEYYENPPPLPANFKPQHPFHNGWMTGRDEALASWPRTEGVVRQQLAEYYGMITHMDDQIGRILKTLEETGHADNTIIVYAADHGLAVGSHGLLGKQNLYEHSMGCPLVFSGPGIPRGATRALTYLYDIYPTGVRSRGGQNTRGGRRKESATDL